ncbi:MAG: SDR family oxidoreductase [Mucilaginibacter sp.]
MNCLDAPELYALVTGASSGIGKIIALEFAKRSINLILVALDNNDLTETALDLNHRFPHIKIITIPVDLSDGDAAQHIFDYCQLHHLTVNMLINNAAVGSSGRFDSHPATFHEYAVKVNLMAPLILTRLFLPEFRKLERAYILNVSSAAAFFNMPYKIIYASTKTFVYSFSSALRQELKKTGISVSTMCSGGVVTSADTKKRTEELGYLSKKLQLTASLVATEAVKGMLEGKALILPGVSSKLFFVLSKLLPYRAKLNLLGRFYGRIYDIKMTVPGNMHKHLEDMAVDHLP